MRYDLGADIVSGSVIADAMTELNAGERIALVAVCALAAAMPATVLNDPGRELPAPATTLQATTQAGIAAGLR
ncbi:hypothetical protein [Kitasatospora sp. NPDC005748]|uniref:hypothetical protein n=1 Tax=Kitasatospora sp. NPDC005748 TaxID=3157063 RepID=UPI0033D4BA4B